MLRDVLLMLKRVCNIRQCVLAVTGKKATVMFSFEPDEDDELSTTVGDVIDVIDEVTLLTYSYGY